jgi:hypothetical protein
VGASHRSAPGAPAPRDPVWRRRRKGGATWAEGGESGLRVPAVRPWRRRRLSTSRPPGSGSGLRGDPGARREHPGDAERPSHDGVEEVGGVANHRRPLSSNPLRRPVSQQGCRSAAEGNRWRGQEDCVRQGRRPLLAGTAAGVGGVG